MSSRLSQPLLAGGEDEGTGIQSRGNVLDGAIRRTNTIQGGLNNRVRSLPQAIGSRGRRVSAADLAIPAGSLVRPSSVAMGRLTRQFASPPGQGGSSPGTGRSLVDIMFNNLPRLGSEGMARLIVEENTDRDVTQRLRAMSRLRSASYARSSKRHLRGESSVPDTVAELVASADPLEPPPLDAEDVDSGLNRWMVSRVFLLINFIKVVSVGSHGLLLSPSPAAVLRLRCHYRSAPAPARVARARACAMPGRLPGAPAPAHATR